MFKNFYEFTLKYSQELKKYRDIIIASKALRGVFLVIFIIGLLLFFTPLFFDNSMLKFSLIQKISRATNADFDINGDIEVSFLPTPTINISEAVLLNYKHKPVFAKNEQLFNFYAKNIKIKFSIFDIYSDNLASEIEFDDGFFEVFSDPKTIPPRNNKITEVLVGYKKIPAVSPTESGLSISNKIFKFSEIIDDDFRHYLSRIPSIRLKNCAFSFFNKLGKNKDFNKINGILNFSQNNNFAQGSFASENIISNFEYNAVFNVDSIKPKSYLYLSSPNLEMHIKGNYTGENKGPFASLFKGEMVININELKSFYQTYFANEKSNIFGKLKTSNNSINIKSNIENEEEEFNLKNIEIESPIISGNGDLYFTIHNQMPVVDINLDLENIDLDEIISQEAIKIENYELAKSIEDLAKNINIANDNEAIKSKIINNESNLIIAKNNEVNADIKIANDNPEKLDKTITNSLDNQAPNTQKNHQLNFDNEIISSLKDFDIISDIKIKNLKFFENQFSNCDVYLTFNKTGEIMILPAIIKTPGNGSFYVRGIIDNTQIPKFIGSIDYKGKNLGEILKWLKLENGNIKFQNLGEFRFYANLLMLPNYSAFNQIYFNLNKNATELFGESKIIRENKNVTLMSDFEITEFNLDKHVIIDNNINNIGKSSLIKKIMWLNNLNINNQLSLNFNKLTYNKQDFINQKINLKLNRGYLNIDNLYLKSAQTDLNLNLLIDISNQTPSLFFKATGPKLNYDADIMPTQGQADVKPAQAQNNESLEENSEENSLAKNAQNLAQNTINNLMSSKNNSSKSKDFLELFYNLPSLESFNGKIEIDIDDIAMKNKNLKEMKFNGELKNGTIDSIKSSWKTYGGDIVYNGLIDIKENKIINGKFTAKNINLLEMFVDNFAEEKISGIANITGNILCVASSKKEFFKDLKSEIKFNIAQPSISGFGINDLVNKMFNAKSNQKELQFPEKILFNPQSKSVFKQARGGITFKNNNVGKIRVEILSPAVNSVLSGSIDSEKQNFDWLYNSVFLTGDTKKPTPINLAIRIKGSQSQYSSTANTNQIRQYLGLQHETYQSKHNANQNNSNSTSINNDSQKSSDANKSNETLTDNNKTINNQINQATNNENIAPNPTNKDIPKIPSLNDQPVTAPKNNEKPFEEFKIIELNE